MDYNFTADVEKKFDDIANGDDAKQKMIGEFYEPFHKDVEFAKENSEKANGERLLGIDPKTKLNVFSKIGRYGPMIQIGDTESEDKPKFASLKSPLSIGSVTLEQALKLFQLPKSLGEYEGVDVNVGIGRFGPYVRYEKMFVSIPKDQDPMTLTKDQATELIEAKKLVEANRMIKQFDEDKNIEVLNGRYGPYIKFGKKNYRIPKDVEPKDLSLADCNELIKAQDSKPKTKTKKTK